MTSRVAFTLVLLLIGTHAAFGRQGQGDVLTIEQLRDMAANRPVLVTSLLVSSDVYPEPASFTASNISHIFRNVLVDATTGRFSMDRSIEIEDAEHDFGAPTVAFTFDGEAQAAFLPDQMMGIVMEDLGVNGLVESGLWGVMMLGEPQPDGMGIDDASMESLLARGTVRDQLELVGDTPCHVVDALYEDTRYATVWLDVERGLLPMKHVCYGHDHNVSSTVAVDSVVFLEDEQVWLPRSWHTEFQARGETLRTYTTIEAESVELDPPVTDDDFQPWFPPGTYVSDQILGLTYRITDSGEIGEILYERVDGEWVATNPPMPDTDSADPHEVSPPPPPVIDNLADLMELAARGLVTKPPQRTERDAETEPKSPTVATKQWAVDSKRPARSAPAPTTQANATVVDTPEGRQPVRHPAPDNSEATHATSPGPPWRWIGGVTAVVALLVIGYAALRRSPA